MRTARLPSLTATAASVVAVAVIFSGAGRAAPPTKPSKPAKPARPSKSVRPASGLSPAEARARAGKLLDEAAQCEVLVASRCPPLKELGGLGEAAVPRLMAALGAKDKGRVAAALAALRARGHEAAGVWALQRLDDPDARLRREAILTVGALHPEGAVEALSRLLVSGDVTLQALAAHALGQTRSPAAVEPLVRALATPAPRVQASALRGLGAVGDERATLAVAAVLADPKARRLARVAACNALGDIGDRRAVPMLVLALGHPSPIVARAAAVSLGRLGDARAAVPLGLALRRPRVALAAARALGRLRARAGVSHALRALRKRRLSPEVMKALFWAVGEMGGRDALFGLLPFLKDSDPKVVVWAAAALGRTHNVEAGEALLEALKRDEPEVKEMAAWALQEISGQPLGQDVERWEQWVHAPDLPQRR